MSLSVSVRAAIHLERFRESRGTFFKGPRTAGSVKLAKTLLGESVLRGAVAAEAFYVG